RSRVKRSASALGSVDLPSSLTAGLSPEEKQQASRVQFTFYINNSLFKVHFLQTFRSVGSLRRLRQLFNSCLFFLLLDGSGGWDDTGCSVVTATPEHTTCSCNHLTSFAILLDLSREGVPDPLQSKILTFITYIGCGISSVFLAVTLITYMLFEKLLRDIPAKILVQLCFSLLLLNLLFLLDGWLSDYKNYNLCISTALHMYLSIVRYALKVKYHTLLNPPLAAFRLSPCSCWLKNDIAYYVGVVAYFILIFVLCLMVFIVVMVQLSRIKKQNPHNQSPNRSAMTDVRSIVGLVLLLGLTWGLALFSWGEIRLPSLYLFTIFNSLLGLFVFIFHCAVKENVRRMWRTYLCCGNMRLAENSEWSRTATHNKSSNLLAATKTISGPQHSNRSSTVASDHTNSSSTWCSRFFLSPSVENVFQRSSFLFVLPSGSVYVDSGISDRSHSDVVLNEIHRRSQSQQGEP
uniref:Adhesion G protein-coupled receptor G2a n=1 Tax=Fundulus heteroclitus TaxID=8078 RepID=A0A3Q2PI32_FUNHE